MDSEERGWVTCSLSSHRRRTWLTFFLRVQKVLPQDPQYRRIPETLLPSGRTTSSPTRICDTDPGVDGLGGLRLHDTRSHSPLSHQSVTGRTALHEASSNGCLNIVELLLPHMSKAECDVQDNDGCTALHLASSNGTITFMCYLVVMGTNIKTICIEVIRRSFISYLRKARITQFLTKKAILLFLQRAVKVCFSRQNSIGRCVDSNMLYFGTPRTCRSCRPFTLSFEGQCVNFPPFQITAATLNALQEIYQQERRKKWLAKG